jgi:hypothetical protein
MMRNGENAMHETVGGLYRNGRIELLESPPQVADETPVLVTFLKRGLVDLAEAGVTAQQAAELRARLASFAEEWESSEMADYDDYEANRRKLDSR